MVDKKVLHNIAEQVNDLISMGKQVILVSSGAGICGVGAINKWSRRGDINYKQALCAIGQVELMMAYKEYFADYGIHVAQILLTRDDFSDPHRTLNIRNAMFTLIDEGVIPVINENDSVSVDEIKIGDNDTLAAYVSRLVDADLLILMSDIDGLYTDDPRKNPNARFIHTVGKIGRGLENMAKGASSDCGTGGMATKIKAAKIATAAGADMIIANGDNIYSINDVMNGKKVGTLFLSEQHQKEMAEEVAPERAEFRRQAKREKKV